MLDKIKQALIDIGCQVENADLNELKDGELFRINTDFFASINRLECETELFSGRKVKKGYQINFHFYTFTWPKGYRVSLYYEDGTKDNLADQFKNAIAAVRRAAAKK